MANSHRIVHAIVTYYSCQVKYDIVRLGRLTKDAIDWQLRWYSFKEVSQHLTRIVALGIPPDAHGEDLGLVQQDALALDISCALGPTFFRDLFNI